MKITPSEKPTWLIGALLALVAGLLTPSAWSQICPAGSSAATFAWSSSSGTGNEWFTSDDTTGNFRVYTVNYLDSGGSPASVDVTVTLQDPDAMNLDDNFSCDPAWALCDISIFPTETNGNYGSNFLTIGMASLSSSDSVQFDFSFSKPMFMDNFTIGDIDDIGFGNRPGEEPEDSYQDEVELSASLGGSNVPVSVSGGSNITIAGQVATANVVLGVDGGLAPGDAAGTVTATTAAVADSFSLIYRNGPDDATNESGAGVSNGHAIRMSGFDFCVQDGLDYGDAPQSYDGNTASAASHILSANLYLGVTAADKDLAPPPWAPALGLPDGDDTDAEGDDEDGVNTGSMITTFNTSGTLTATLDILEVTNNLSSDAQLVCWIDFDKLGTFSDTSGNSGITTDPNERSHPELVAHTLTRLVAGTPATDHYAVAVTSSSSVVSTPEYAESVVSSSGMSNTGNATGMQDGNVASSAGAIGDEIVLNMVDVSIASGDTFDLRMSGDNGSAVEVFISSSGAGPWTSVGTVATVGGLADHTFTATSAAQFIRVVSTKKKTFNIDAVIYSVVTSGVVDPTNALSAPNTAVASMLATSDQIVLDMGVAGTISNGSTFTITARGGDSGTGTATVETSPDNVTYYSAGGITNPGTSLTGLAFTNSSGFDAQYVRIILTSGAGVEEIRIDSVHYFEAAVPDSTVACTDVGITDDTYTTGNIPAGCSGTAQLFWSNMPAVPTAPSSVYTRCRLTTDGSFLSDNSPTATGAVSDGEVEDDLIDIDPLPVTLSHFDSTLSGKKLEIDWGTSSELFNVGFQLWGLDRADDQWGKLHNRLIRSGSGNAVEPQSYANTVKVPRSIDDLIAVGISSVDSDGSEHYYGPFDVGVSYGDLSTLEPIAWNQIRDEVDAQMQSNGYLKAGVNGYRKAELSGDSTVSGPSATDQVVEFSVSSDGLYRITSSELSTVGMDLSDVASGEIALVDHHGNAVVCYVLAKGKGRGPNKTLGANGEIYFYGQAPDESDGLYTDASVYRLVLDGAKAHNALIQPKQGLKDGFSDTYIEHSVVENDAIYVLNSAADDPWVSGVVVGYADQPSLYGVQVPVEADALWDQPSALLLGLGRSSHLPGVDTDGDGTTDAEHIVEGLALDSNNELVRFGQRTAVGQGLWDVEFEIPAGTALGLNEGHAVVGGGFSAGAGYAFSEVHVDRVGLAYTRPTSAKADEDYLMFAAPISDAPGYAVTIPNDGLAVVFASDGANLVRINPESQQRIKNASGETQRVVRFAALQGVLPEGGQLTYWVSAKNGSLRVAGLSPRTIPSQASVLAQAQGSDYLLIAHPAFVGADAAGVDHLSSYAAFKQSQGYRVSMINYLDVVDAFGGGQAGPSALSTYLDAVYRSHGQLQHILLVGGSTYDHTGNLNTGAITFIPGHYGQSNYSNYTLSDVPYIQDQTGELFASIGRWPVRTMGDLGHIVDKSMLWSQAAHTQGEALLIAENTLTGENIDFGSALDSVVGSLPLDWTTNKVDVDEILAANPGYTQTQAFTQARGEIIDHLNAAPELVLFNGHADTRQLSNNGLFKSSHIGQVTAPGAEVWVPMSCYVTFYESTHVNTLAHQLLFSGNAVSITGAMLLSDQAGNISMGQSILDGVFNGGQTLGAAVKQSKTQINNPQLDINWAFLGDTTLRMVP